MILISESKEEDSILPGLSALIEDLGVLTTEYRMDEAYAVIFWSAADLSHMYADRVDLTQEEAAYLLEELEPFLRAAMATAGAKLIDRSLHKNLSDIKKFANDPFFEE